jgi:hypothetical protein
VSRRDRAALAELAIVSMGREKVVLPDREMSPTAARADDILCKSFRAVKYLIFQTGSNI